MTFRARLAGCRIAEVPIIFTERQSGRSKMSRSVIWESLWVPLALRCRERALRRRLGHCGQSVAAPPALKKAA